MFINANSTPQLDRHSQPPAPRRTRGRRGRYAKLVAMVPLALVGCASGVEQEVTGRLLSASGAVGNSELRLYESQLCSGNFVDAKSDREGRFSFHMRTANGGLSEVKQELALCQKRNGFWQALWSSGHRGGAARVELNCTIGKEGKGACNPTFNYGA